MKTIGFIGGGNMATAIIGGLCADDPQAGASILVVEPVATIRKQLENLYGVHGHSSPTEAIATTEIIILAVKPQIIPVVIQQIKAQLHPGQLLISIAAGVSCEKIESLLGRETAIVRAMPNTPALIGKGISGLYANAGCQQDDKNQAQAILAAVGQTVWVGDEQLMDAVTAVSGSGPAYAFYLIEAMRDAGVKAGLSLDLATTLAANTVAGAGQLALQSTTDVTQLRQQVTSPGGTTAAAMDELINSGWDKIIHRAVLSARDRGRELARGDENGAT